VLTISETHNNLVKVYNIREKQLKNLQNVWKMKYIDIYKLIALFVQEKGKAGTIQPLADPIYISLYF
jgi:hypothetical protein